LFTASKKVASLRWGSALEQHLQRRADRAHDAQFHRRATPESEGPLVDLHHAGLLGEKFRIGIVGAQHEHEVGLGQRIDARSAADEADAADPARIVVGHDILAAIGMDQRGLQPVRQRSEFTGGALAAEAAEDGYRLGLIDHLRQRRDVFGRRSDRGARAQGGDAGDGAAHLRREHVRRDRNMRDAALAVSLRDGLMDHRCRLVGRGDDLAVDADIVEQGDGIVLLQIVDAALGRGDATGNRQHWSVILARFVEPGDEVVGARPGSAAAHAEAAGDFRLTGRGQRRAFLVPHADPLHLVLPPDRVSEGVEGVTDNAEHLVGSELIQSSDEKFGDSERHGCFSCGGLGRGEQQRRCSPTLRSRQAIPAPPVTP